MLEGEGVRAQKATEIQHLMYGSMVASPCRQSVRHLSTKCHIQKQLRLCIPFLQKKLFCKHGEKGLTEMASPRSQRAPDSPPNLPDLISHTKSLHSLNVVHVDVEGLYFESC